MGREETSDGGKPGHFWAQPVYGRAPNTLSRQLLGEGVGRRGFWEERIALARRSPIGADSRELASENDVGEVSREGDMGSAFTLYGSVRRPPPQPYPRQRCEMPPPGLAFPWIAGRRQMSTMCSSPAGSSSKKRRAASTRARDLAVECRAVGSPAGASSPPSTSSVAHDHSQSEIEMCVLFAALQHVPMRVPVEREAVVEKVLGVRERAADGSRAGRL